MHITSGLPGTGHIRSLIACLITVLCGSWAPHVVSKDWNVLLADAETQFKAAQYAQALSTYQHIAEETANALAQFRLGWIYHNGLGVPQDCGEAARWYTLAATNASAHEQFRSLVLLAQNNLSVLYSTGCPNLQADEKSAVFYLKMAANSGDSRAQANLAARTASGEQGVAKNPYEAYALALKSATQKDPYGRIVLAGFYAGGIGVPADAKKAFDLIKQGSLDKSEEDLQQEAQFAQAGMHETGEGTSRNLDESYKWYLIAAAGPKVEMAKQAKAAATALEAKLSAEAIHKAQEDAQQWLREHRGTAISADELFDEAKSALATGDDKSALVAARAMAAIGDARGETISGALYDANGNADFYHEDISFDQCEFITSFPTKTRRTVTNDGPLASEMVISVEAEGNAVFRAECQPLSDRAKAISELQRTLERYGYILGLINPQYSIADSTLGVTGTYAGVKIDSGHQLEHYGKFTVGRSSILLQLVVESQQSFPSKKTKYFIDSVSIKR